MNPRNSLKVLAIGNSFSESLNVYWPQVAESAGYTLHLEQASHGGCELHRHWNYISNEEKDSVYRMYQGYTAKMRDILAREQWDIVTIQQASHFSWRPETMQPFAGWIADYVKQHAPQAELRIQQTWAYREDDPRIRPGGIWEFNQGMYDRCRELGVKLDPGPWKINQTGMYNALTAAYAKLAEELDCRIIPTGYAVQLARKAQKDPFPNYDPELMNTLRWPDLPPQASEVVGNIYWTKNAATGELEMKRDTIHLNVRGQYLQACVWFAALFGHKTSEVTFVPDTIGNRDAAFLREIAQKAVDEFPLGKR